MSTWLEVGPSFTVGHARVGLSGCLGLSLAVKPVELTWGSPMAMLWVRGALH